MQTLIGSLRMSFARSPPCAVWQFRHAASFVTTECLNVAFIAAFFCFSWQLEHSVSGSFLICIVYGDACGSWQLLQSPSTALWVNFTFDICVFISAWQVRHRSRPCATSSLGTFDECPRWHESHAPAATGPWMWALLATGSLWQVAHSSRIEFPRVNLFEFPPCGLWHERHWPSITGL